MAQEIKIGFEHLCREAEAEVDTITVEQAMELHGSDDVVFVDIRDIRELSREGRMPGAVHAPRGMLEFWVDPESPYHREVFDQDKRYIFFCAAGWRSALATQQLQRMGLKPVSHIAGGFAAWKEAGAAIDLDKK
jgi:rhodanese-related sulfurtransferase